MGNKRNKSIEKYCVTVRFKILKSGNKSIYLDCYSQGKRTYEFLKLYLVPETSQNAIDANKEVMRKAELIREERELLYSGKGSSESANAEEMGIVQDTSSEQAQPIPSFPTVIKSTVLLTDMVRIYGVAYEIKGSLTGYNNAKSLVAAIEQYGATNTTLDEVDVAFCTKFVKFLKTNCVSKRGSKIGDSTAEALFNTLSAALSIAVRLNFMDSNPVSTMESKDKVKRRYAQHLILSLEDIRRLAGLALPSKRHQVKESFMFACYSGIKLCELRDLRWKDLTLAHNRWTMTIPTRNIDIVLTNDAMQWLPQRGKAKVGDLVFNDLPCDNAVNYIIKDWMKKANLSEEINFSISFYSYEHYNAKSRAQIKAETKYATCHTRWRLNCISKRAQQNVEVAAQVQQQPNPTQEHKAADKLPTDALDAIFSNK